jgi:hypothetical protein
MKKQDYTIQLIRSLDPNERRYFRLLSNLQQGEKKYLQLFDLLADLDEYNATAISRQMGLSKAQLAETKYYLNDAVLSCLRNTGQQSTQIAALYVAKEDARLLTGRRMHLQALELARKTADRAMQLEQFELMVELLNIMQVTYFNNTQFDEAAEIYERYRKVADMQNEIMLLLNLKVKVTKGQVQRNKGAELQKLVKHPLLKGGPEKLKSLRAKIAWFDTMYHYYIAMDRSDKALETSRREWKCFSENPIIKIANGTAYIVAYTRLAYAEHTAGNNVRALQLAGEIKHALVEKGVEINKATRTGFMAYIESFRMYVLLRMERFADVLRESPAVAEMMKARPLPEQYAHTFNHALALVHANQHQLAIDELNKLLAINTNLRLDLQQLARLLLVMVHVDLNNNTMVPHLVKSARSWMKRHQIANESVNVLYRYFLQAARAPAAKKRVIYAQCLAEMRQGRLQPLANTLMLPAWLEKRT